MKILLIAGMIGFNDWNREKYRDAALDWRMAGHEVYNPGEVNLFTEIKDIRAYEGCAKLIMSHLIQCDAVAVLPDWENCKDVLTVLATAIICGKRIFDATTREELHLIAIARSGGTLIIDNIRKRRHS